MSTPSPSPSPDSILDRFVAAMHPPCPACRTPLTALKAGRCPACHEPLTLRLRTAEPRQGAFITGAIGLSVGLGFTLAWVCGAAIALASGFPLRDVLDDGWPLIPMLAIQAAALWAWLRFRRRLRLRPRDVRVLLAAACWGLSILLAALFYVRVFS